MSVCVVAIQFGVGSRIEGHWRHRRNALFERSLEAVAAAEEDQGRRILSLDVKIANCSYNDMVIPAFMGGFDVAVDPGKRV